MRLDPLSPRQRWWFRASWRFMLVSVGFAVLAYVLGYPAGTTTFAWGIIWPLLTAWWSVLYKSVLTRHGEW